MTQKMTFNQKTIRKPRVLSSQTAARIAAIRKDIKDHKASIAYLQAIVQGRIDLGKSGSTYAIRCYQRTREDEVRLPKTLENLKQQIHLLKHEEEALNTYGR